MKKQLFVFLSFLFFAHQSFAQIQKNWTWGGPIHPLQEQFQVVHYQLNLEIFPETQKIKGSNKVTFHADERLDTLRLDLIEEYQVSKVIMDGKEIRFEHVGDVLDIFPVDCTCNEVEIFYEGETPIAIRPPWTGGFTWEMDELGNHWMGLSSQNEGAKIFMPCLDHPSSEPINGVDLFFTVPKPYFVASNGRLAAQEDLGDRYRYHWSTQYPINNYNVNFTVGVFYEASKVYQSIDGKEIPMYVYVLQQNKSKAYDLLQVLETSTQTLEKYLGPYPFGDDKIAVVETPYLGMEHQTINGYGNNFKFEKVGDVWADWLLHHELGHEWFGNKVSVKDWADFWIHEGLTAYADWLFYLEHGGEEAYHQKVASVRVNIRNLRPVVSPRNSHSDFAYHPEIYTKGAFIIHSLRYFLGDEIFFPMLKAFASDERFTYENLVDTNDFTSFVQQYAEQDLQGFFDLYLKSVRLPQVKVSKKGKRGYAVSLPTIDFSIPVEIKTSNGLERHVLSSNPVLVRSDGPIVVDPNYWYLLDKK
ncbi:M1 family metallopeptidase [Mongoliitalea daihaiensis]|uniref:M1 family metallopeptidase n=1 Tax=Mongoliitalea daihaiensis TaxID=2782006 RepID=UPI001F3EAEE2|nr:M1 family metallopeptidase [Mongoliitalea daihaiensis]UJP65574.1 M1 family metallopeptidase [Mongoliitalea daihaiensis]